MGRALTEERLVTARRPGFLQRIRQHHALEHATIHMLAGLSQGVHVMGRSDWSGFTIYGDVRTDALARAADLALLRLQGGDARLAVHPRCGTNLASGILAAILFGQVASWTVRPRALRWVATLLGVGAGLALSEPLGREVQTHVTTLSDLRGARIAAVRREAVAGMIRHRVVVVHAEGQD